MVAALDPLGELDLLRRSQQVDLADVFQEQLERVGRDVGGVEVERLLFRLLLGLDENSSIWPVSRESSSSVSVISSAESFPAVLPVCTSSQSSSTSRTPPGAPTRAVPWSPPLNSVPPPRSRSR
jgi:hypothetical protein